MANCPILGEIHTQTFYTAQDYLGNQINCENHCSSLKNLPCSQDLPVPVQSAPGQAREAGSLQLLRWQLGFGQSSLPALGFSFSCQPKKQEEFSSKHEKKEGLKKENVMVGEIRINFSTTSNLCSSQALCTIHPPPLWDGAGTLPTCLIPNISLQHCPAALTAHPRDGLWKINSSSRGCSPVESLCSHCKDQPQMSGIPRTGLVLLLQLTGIKQKIQMELGNGFAFQEKRNFFS